MKRTSKIKGFVKGLALPLALGFLLKPCIDSLVNWINKHDFVARTLSQETQPSSEQSKPGFPMYLEGYKEVDENKGKKDFYQLLLERDTYTDKATLGKLYLNGGYVCETLELPWQDNKKNISCIPAGSYSVRRRTSERFPYEHLSIEDVKGRSEILIHRGNYPKDTNGCILVGNFRGKNIIQHSRKTLSELMNKLDHKDMRLEIRER